MLVGRLSVSGPALVGTRQIQDCYRVRVCACPVSRGGSLFEDFTDLGFYFGRRILPRGYFLPEFRVDLQPFDCVMMCCITIFRTDERLHDIFKIIVIWGFLEICIPLYSGVWRELGTVVYNAETWIMLCEHRVLPVIWGEGVYLFPS